MTDHLDPTSLEPEKLLDGLDPEDLDGHTIEELSDYLDAGREPRNESIENSPGSRIALDSLARLRKNSWAMLELEADSDPDRDRNWIKNVFANISLESRAGRDILVSHPDPSVRLRITEGSVRGLIRAAGDGLGGAIIGKVELVGDITAPNQPVAINITASVAYGEKLPALAQQLRDTIASEVLIHTELTIVDVNVSIEDIHTKKIVTTGEAQ